MASPRKHVKKKKGILESMAAAFRRSSRPNEANHLTELDEIGKTSGAFTTHMTMHQVAREGNVEMMEHLLERIPQLQVRKKRLNQRDESKLAPIHYAARHNHRHMIEYLIKNGANPQAIADDDATALHYLAKYKHKSINSGTPRNNKEKSRLESQSEDNEQRSIVELLVSSGANVNAKDVAGQTPLHLACEREHAELVSYLLKCTGLDLEMVDNQGMTALHLACLNGHSNIVRLLVEAGADLRCRDKEMMTPMHVACGEGSLEIAQILFEAGEKQNIGAGGPNVKEKPKNRNLPHQLTRSALQTFSALHRSSLPETQPQTKTNMVWAYSNKALDNHETPFCGAMLLLDQGYEKNLPLHLAIENGHLDLAKFSIEKTKAAGVGSMVDSVRSGNNSCLHLAVQANSIEIVKLLLDEGADINARNSFLASPLYLACQQNAHMIVKHLAERSCDVETADDDSMTPFLVASRYGHLETLTWLIEHNADVTATDKNDKTCLMWAAEEDRADAIRLLMTNHKIKQSIEEKDKYNNTALHLASMKGHSVTVKLLLDYQASTESRNDADRNTLHMAALHGHHSIIPDLVNRDRSIINAGDEEGNTVLHLAAIGGNIKCVTILIQLGSNLGLRNAKQWTALDCACAFGFVKSAKALLEAGADIGPFAKIKISPLHLACQRGHVEVVELLLEWKADVTFRSIDGRNALDYAIDFGQRNCVLVLIKHPTWRDSLRNAYIYPMTGRLITPMRKMIKKMEDMAEIVCNQCIEDNGKKTDDNEFQITLFYELLDDMYSMGQWVGNTDTGSHRLTMTDEDCKVYDESGHVTEDAFSYTEDSDTLLKNHPLMIMVKSKCGVLLKHPVVVGLLDYKWQRFGRYVYYTNLVFFLFYLVLLNAFVEHSPLIYQIDWVKMLQVRKIKAGLYTNTSDLQALGNDSLDCFYYREEVVRLPHDPVDGTCTTLSPATVHLQRAVLVFSAFNLLREIVQFISQRVAYFNIMNVVAVTLYVLSLILTIDFTPYTLRNLSELTKNVVNNSELQYLESVQQETGLRQEWQQDIGAFSIFLSWMVLLLYIQKLPMFGIFVVMFTDVLKTFSQFFVVLAMFIVGFALTFNILLGNQPVFHEWYWSIPTTIAMMVGEINYSATFFTSTEIDSGQDYFTTVYSKEVSAIVFMIFIFVMTIIIMNLLVGLAVGDIMEVQENANLERFRMQVDLALEVEFALPEFLRKKLCLGKQNIQINKYRKANFFKRLLFENPDLTLECIGKYLDKEEADQSNDLSNMDNMIIGMDNLRNRVTDLLSEVADVRQDIRDVRGKLIEVQSETKLQAQDIKVNVVSTSNELSERIQQTHSDQIETTHHESTQTRGGVNETRQVVVSLLEDVDRSRRQTEEVILAAEERLKSLQEQTFQQQWHNLESTLAKYHDTVEKGRRAIMEGMDEMQLMLAKKRHDLSP